MSGVRREQEERLSSRGNSNLGGISSVIGGVVQEEQTGWRGGGLEEKRVREAEKWWKRNEWDVLVHKQKL